MSTVHHDGFILTYKTVTGNFSIYITVTKGRYFPQRANETQATGRNLGNCRSLL
jgi:hypothetical protein